MQKRKYIIYSVGEVRSQNLGEKYHLKPASVIITKCYCVSLAYRLCHHVTFLSARFIGWIYILCSICGDVCFSEETAAVVCSVRNAATHPSVASYLPSLLWAFIVAPVVELTTLKGVQTNNRQRKLYGYITCWS